MIHVREVGSSELQITEQQITVGMRFTQPFRFRKDNSLDHRELELSPMLQA